MGMAASQARFLGLTARKSNTEYEGQQVNQQRTALANESASLYNQLTNLSVPTPPDITNYYSTEYSFNYNGKTYTMTSLPVRGENGYSVSLSHIERQYAYETVNADGLDASQATDTTYTLSQYSALQQHIAASGMVLPAETAVKSFSQDNNRYFVVNNQFYKDISSDQVVESEYSGVEIKYSETGDLQTINVPQITNGAKVAVSTTSVADDSAYDEAMNAYKKEYSEYEKTMAQINAKTEVLQQQDKTLELRLNQLDTEQNAISTEMDAVQKVIEKNVESTFKTFA